MTIRTLHHETLLPAPLSQVFPFFSQAENLERLTPSKLKFEILTPTPVEMRPGAIIDYRLRLFGIPFRWKTEITVWEPGVRFVDVQRRGPYLLWEHEHRFESAPGGTLMTDNLRYAVPGWFLEPLVWSLFVRRQVEGIFRFREQAIQEVFEGNLRQVA